MRVLLGKILSVLVCGIMAGASALATAGVNTCQGVWPEPFPAGQSFLLNDPRSGLMLYIESDGRHMAAIAREGKVLWHRNLFDDPRLERMFPPPPQIEGEPPVSAEEWHRHMHSYVGHLTIDRIEIEPDCALHYIDHDLPPQLRGHYIRTGSGTHVFYLLDAKTGDFQMEEVN